MKFLPTRKKGKCRSKSLSLAQFFQKRDELLIVREVGGLGDILMHRMLFEDIKRQYPDLRTVFACPKQFHDAVLDHPFIDKVLDSKDVDLQEYLVSYNTSTACKEYECAKAPYSGDHRSDIWASHIGIKLENHSMHLCLNKSYESSGKLLIDAYRKGRDGPSVALCPISAMMHKDFTKEQLITTVQHLARKGCFVFGLHTAPIPTLAETGVPVLYGLSIPQWMGLISAADYVVTVDSAATHFAGAIGKPQVTMFTFADGKVYGRYYDKFILVQQHRDNGNWDCGPCYWYSKCPKTRAYPKPCLTELPPGAIVEGIDKMLEKYPPDT